MAQPRSVQSREQAPRAPGLLAPRTAYDRWAPSYADSGRNPLTRSADALLLPWLEPVAGLHVLDLGCGLGRWSRRALDGGAASCVGLDLSRGMLRQAGERLPALMRVEAELDRLPLVTGGFDLVVLALALSHVEQPEPALEECARVLDRAGRLLLVDLHAAAAAAGWRRSFRDPSGRSWEPRWWGHDPHRVAEACRRVGLKPIALREARLRPEDLPPGAPAGAGRPLALYALSARPRTSG